MDDQSVTSILVPEKKLVRAVERMSVIFAFEAELDSHHLTAVLPFVHLLRLVAYLGCRLESA